MVSCKKKELNFTLKGTVTDHTFGGGLNGAVLNLEEISSNGKNLGVVAEATISSDGNYELTFKRNSSLKYILTVTKPNYFNIFEEIPFGDFSTEEDLVKNYSSKAKAWVKLTFNNNAPILESDFLHYTKQEGKQDCEECCPKTEQEVTGITGKTIYCLNDGNTTYSYSYLSNSTPTPAFKTIVTPAFDTVEIITNY